MRRVIQFVLIGLLICCWTWVLYACRKETNQADYKDQFGKENLTLINKDSIDGGGQDFVGLIIEGGLTDPDQIVPPEIDLISIDNIITTPETVNLNCSAVSNNVLLEYLGLNPGILPDNTDPFLFTRGVWIYGGTNADIYPVLGLGLPANQTEFSPYLYCFKDTLLYLILRNPAINDEKIRDQDAILRSLKNLKRLDLQTASIVTIPSVFNDLTELTHLDISRSVSDQSANLRGLGTLKSITLQYLNINYTGVQKIDSLNNYALETLLAKQNGLYAEDNLISFIQSTRQLTKLDLSENSLDGTQLAGILDQISSNIQYLDLSENYSNNNNTYQFTSNHLQNLRYLDLSETKLLGFSDAFYTLKNIEALYLANNDFSLSVLNKITDNIERLTKLRVLDLRNTNIQEISQKICTLGTQNDKVKIYLSSAEKNQILQTWAGGIPTNCYVEFIDTKHVKKSFTDIKTFKR